MTLKVEQILELLRKAEVYIKRSKGGDIAVVAGRENLTTELVTLLKENKLEILQYLEEKELNRMEKVKESSDGYPLSSSQNRFWFLNQLDGVASAYNVPLFIQVNGRLDFNRLEKAFVQVVAKHEILRTVFKATKDGAKQYVLPIEEVKIKLHTEDFRNRPEKEFKAYVYQCLTKEFALDTFPLFELNSAIQDNKTILLFNFHHIICDGWSMQNLLSDLMLSYESGMLLEESVNRIQFKDYVSWEAKYLLSERSKEDEKYWYEKLSSGMPVVELPSQKIRPKHKTIDGALVKHGFSDELVKRLHAYAVSKQVSSFNVLLTGSYAIISRYANQKEIPLGTPLAGRGSTELNELIGPMLKTVPIKIHVDQEVSFDDLVMRVSKEMQEVFKHQNYPIEKVLERIRLERDPSRNPLYDILVTHQFAQQQTEAYFEPFNLEGKVVSKLDMSFNFFEGENELSLQVEYNTDIYEEWFVNDLVQHLENFISIALENSRIAIESLDFLSVKTQRLLKEFNETAIDFGSSETLVSLFLKSVQENPEKTAIVFGEKRLSFAEIDQVTNQLAAYLIQTFEVKLGDRVVVDLNRSEYLAIALLAVQRAGGVYVPVSKAYPEARKTFIVQQTESKLVLDQEVLKGFFIEKNKYKLEREIELKPSDSAYIIFTSGSTGNPKGCELQHAGVVNRLTWMWKDYSFDANEVVLQKTSATFDVSVWEFFLPLCFGASMVIASESEVLEPSLLRACIKRNKVSTLHFVPGVLMHFMDDWTRNKTDFSSLKKVFTSGESLPLQLANQWNKEFAATIINFYGPTEASIDVTAFDTSEAKQKMLIGKPVANTGLYVLNDKGQPQPIGVKGELFIAGVQLAKGYFNDDKRTRESFVSLPSFQGEKLYKTGDVVSWTPEGNLEFHGRKDFQLKIRGFRIELAEIENAFMELEGVQGTLITTKEFKGEKQIVAFWRGDKTLTNQQIIQELSTVLPAYMVPYLIEYREAFPITVNGKVDRKQLLESLRPDFTIVELIAPETELQEKIKEIWLNLLPVEAIGIKNNFFHSGGHSLLALRLKAHLQDVFGKSISLSLLFENPTIEEQAILVEKSESKGRSHNKIEKSESKEYYPLTSSQKRIWVLSELEDSGIAFHLPMVYRLKGELKLNQLEKAIFKVVERHASLRTNFVLEGSEVVQKITPFDQLDFEVEKLEVDNEKQLEKIVEKKSNELFNLEKDLLFRVSIICLKEENILFMNQHHIISDGWSLELLFNEILTVYQEGEKALLPMELAYSDYAVWLNNEETKKELESHKSFWYNLFDLIPEPLNLPISVAARPEMKTYNGDVMTCSFSAESYQQINRFVNENGGSLFSFLQTVLSTLLFKLSRQTSFVIGTPVSGRTQKELEPMIGVFINLLPLLQKIDKEEEWLSLYKKTSQRTVEALDHQLYPFDLLVQELNLPRDTSRAQLFDVMIMLNNVQNIRENQLYEEIGLDISPYDKGTRGSKYDLTFNFSEEGEELVLQLEYNTDLYKESSIREVLSYFEELVKGILDTPTKKVKDLVYYQPKQSAIVEGKYQKVAYSSVVDLWENTVQKVSDKLAVITKSKQITYKEIDVLSNRVATYLVEGKGLKKEDRVVLNLKRTPHLLASIIGTLKAGLSFIPVDQQWPSDRITYVKENSGCNFELTDKAFVDIQQRKEATVFDVITPSQECYTIYTSGSTGKPKGVSVSHQSLVNLLNHFKEELGVDQEDRVWASSSQSFDISYLEMLLAMTSGAATVLIDEEESKDIKALGDRLKRDEPTIIQSTPAGWNLLLRTPKENWEAVRVLVGGEALGTSLKKQLCQLGAKAVYNVYGPTESTIWSTVAKMHVDEEVHVGQPIANTSCVVVDDEGSLVGKEVWGELGILGDGLALGYVNDLEQTQTRFKDLLVSGSKQRVYLTGDVARIIDGRIALSGRKDRQVKLRGYRIELDEIENSLTAFDEIELVAVVLIEPKTEQAALVAYVEMTEGEVFQENSIRKQLAQKLPVYMLPSELHVVEKMPLTSSGKVDRKYLVANYTKNSVSESIEESFPVTELAKKLLALWEEVLQCEVQSFSDDFFRLGGDSIRVIALRQLIEEQLNVKLEYTELFQNASFKALYSTLEGKAPIETESVLKPERTLDPYTTFELTPMQQAYFIGKQEMFELSVATQLYYEIGVEQIDIERFKYAFNELIARHDMLRCKFNGDMKQQIVAKEEITSVPFEVLDWSALDKQVVESSLGELRSSMNSTPLDHSKPCVFDVKLLMLPNEKYKVLFVVDLLIADGHSLNVLSTDFERIYQGENLPPLTYSFKEYVGYTVLQRESESYLRAKEYWQDRLPNLPLGPELRTAIQPKKIQVPSYDNLQGILHPEKWKFIREFCFENKVSPTIFFTTVFADVLKKWGGGNHFLLNLTLFNRLPIHKEVNQIVGDFTDSLLLQCDVDRQDFEERLQMVQKRFLADMDHRLYTGVEVNQLLNNREKVFDKLLTPVVLTSVLNNEEVNWEEAEALYHQLLSQEKNVGGVQTSQVWLDFQLMSFNGVVTFNWTYVEQLFPENMIQDMFNSFLQAIDLFCESNTLQIPLPEWQQVCINETNATHLDLKKRSLISAFEQQVKVNPDRVVLVQGDVRLTLMQIDFYATKIAAWLQAKEVGSEELVGIISVKSYWQVIAAIGIMKTGAAYLPVDASLPKKRIESILEEGKVSKVLLNKELTEFKADAKYTFAELSEKELEGFTSDFNEVAIDVTNLAYTIFTSGSTGKPKGVMISHEAAMNTIDALNEKYKVTANDKVLGVSSMSFDLSVYDVFGVLGIGGTLVLPSHSNYPQPAEWLSLVKSEGITVWNSVPQLADLLCQQLKLEQKETQDLRLVMMSGDWIPLNLPSALKDVAPQTEIYSLGGATEAAIWSIDFKIDELQKNWNSIPYGKPLPNQTFHVLDEDLTPCPVWVEGDLYIGGVGLAMGYFNDEEKTKGAFIQHEKWQKRIYKTGDRGSYYPDGNIEFLGRKDSQVKVRGYRIELGEIEFCLQRLNAIETAIVLAVDDGKGDKILVAYILSEEKVDTNSIGRELQHSLPSYMVPKFYVQLDEMPLTPNGKLDRKALPMPDVDAEVPEETKEKASTYTELKLLKLWEEVLGLKSIGVNDNFFDLGGQSLKVFQLMKLIRETLSVTIEVGDLFENRTLKAQAEHIDKIEGEDKEALEKAPNQESYPLTEMQRAYWTASQNEKIAASYNLISPFRIRESIDVEKLKGALLDLLEHQVVLRTVFYFDASHGEVRQKVLDTFDTNEVFFLQKEDSNWKEDAVNSLLQNEVDYVFDLAEGLNIRLSCIQFESEMAIVLNVHHIISDAISMHLIFEQLLNAYYGLSNERSNEWNFIDYAYSEYQNTQDSPKSYWVKKLKNLPSEIPLTGKEEVLDPTLDAQVLEIDLKSEEIESIQRFISNQSMSRFSALYTIVNIWLSAESTAEDIVVATPVSLRDKANTEDMIGLFLNTVLLRTYVNNEETVAEIAQSSSETIQEALIHSSYPFMTMAEELEHQGSLFTVGLNYNPIVEGEKLDSSIEPISFGVKKSKAPIWIDVNETTPGLHMMLSLQKAYFSEQRMENLKDSLHWFMKQAFVNNEQSLSDLLSEWNESKLLNRKSKSSRRRTKKTNVDLLNQSN